MNELSDFEMLDLKITRAWMQLLKAKSNDDIDKRMACVDALLDQRLLLTDEETVRRDRHDSVSDRRV
jgi:hypothetical protein